MTEPPAAASTPQGRGRPFWLGDKDDTKAGAQILARNFGLQVRKSPAWSSRVNKLDADLLDDEIFDMLNAHVKDAFSLVKPTIFDRFKPELTATLQSMLFGLSILSSRRATYGQGLQNLKYDSAKGLRSRLYLFGILTIGGQYGWARLNRCLMDGGWADLPMSDWRHRVHRLVDKAERYFKLASLLNYLAFLANGRYKSVVERILSLRLTYAKPQLAHSVSMEFLNRQMVWHAFTEFLMFVVPLVNAAKLRATVGKAIRKALGLPPASVDEAIAKLPKNTCAICFTASPARDVADGAAVGQFDTGSCRVTNPYSGKCGHAYCYICIRTKLMVEKDACCCLRCGTRISAIKPSVSIQGKTPAEQADRPARDDGEGAKTTGTGDPQ
ncbi:peroxisome assembly protein (Peroxin-2) [Spiromyces aspiralis]|uniref:Peroxisome assembly protein (Peroxin-2) n=1 Tax=Spiromyces aspiralis TaxID=68401 RepID=A0ACC1HDM3_9FUNG|nr:peroxisome assembly protein (Peroxin-2) [Spiromyces aspiralis]